MRTGSEVFFLTNKEIVWIVFPFSENCEKKKINLTINCSEKKKKKIQLPIPISSAKIPPLNLLSSWSIIQTKLSLWKGRRGSLSSSGCGASVGWGGFSDNSVQTFSNSGWNSKYFGFFYFFNFKYFKMIIK